jgi:hypothetical protein
MKSSKNNIFNHYLVQLLIVIAIIIFINIISSNIFERFDLTSEKRYTLSSSTQALLKNVDDIIYFRVYLDGEFPAGFKRLRRETKELLNELFRVVNKNNVSENLFVNIEKTETLRIWLSQLCLMKDFSKSLENKKKIVKKILAILEKANEDKAFYDVFVDVILDGSGTCGDRVALSILYIGINYKLSQFSISKQESLIIKKEKLKDLALFLKGLWGIGLLSFVAGEKIKLMRVEDQIEVHLAYPVMLQKILNLPIDVEDMLFFNISGVLEEDLQNARKFVEFHYASNDLFVEFLINHFKWEEAILNSFLIESQISRACKEEEPDYVGIAEKFKKEMKEKTLEILREISEDVKIKV